MRIENKINLFFNMVTRQLKEKEILLTFYEQYANCWSWDLKKIEDDGH
jgi:hypothetical protein